ncbi:MAG: CBS domain-containing protein [Kofleriaceae bacterium]|nr:MAG: CBS domain-containing protein [Kofleriaceae bacterium]MBZ0238406.1 CBS domain-containing protein [Kofleriaceae bacterium]
MKGSDVEVTTADASVVAAVEQMNRRNIGALLVMDGERSLGIFTERDVLTRVIGKGRDPGRTPVGEVMTRSVISIGPETTVKEAMSVITEKRCRHLPVMAGGRLLGMISAGDLTRWTVRDQQRTIEELVDYVQRS